MTRITNFGIKRTYLEAGFGAEAVENGSAKAGEPVKKKSKRRGKPREPKTRLPKTGTDTVGADASNEAKGELQVQSVARSKALHVKPRSKKSLERVNFYSRTDSRREKRISDRMASITCYACRTLGHTADKCPGRESDLDYEKEEAPVMPMTGICYRCGSFRHALSRCKKPASPDGSLPFASCYVCSATGHLASACPKGRGVYPNGGSCKICRQVDHLAKDCKLRDTANQPASQLVFLAPSSDTIQAAGADEDDFHAIKRRTADVDKEEKDLERTKKRLAVKAGALSGTIVNHGKGTGVKKPVVFF